MPSAGPSTRLWSQYPAILIGQLCVFDGFGGLDIGDEMMDLIKTLAINPENRCAARYLVVAVNHPKVLEYYRKNGFEFLFDSDEEEQGCLHKSDCPTRLMSFDLIVLRQKI